jgi:hypothetical protein
MADEKTAEDKNPAQTKDSYLLGGLWLNIPSKPEELLKWYKEEKKKGMRPSPMLLMIWQRAAIHCAYLQHTLIPELREQIAELAERVRKLEGEHGRRGST